MRSYTEINRYGDKGKWRAAITKDSFPVILPINSLFFLSKFKLDFCPLKLKEH